MRGDGTPERDFIYVGDVVDALILAAQAGTSGVYNVGTGKSYSLNQVVEKISEIAGKKVKVVHLPATGECPEAPGMPELGKNYITVTRADTTKSMNELGFAAKCSLEEGLKKLLRGGL